jgi:3-deoxy-manno-octulosonate cytidylyltransferase (CMP-KDO synthetase)
VTVNKLLTIRASLVSFYAQASRPFVPDRRQKTHDIDSIISLKEHHSLTQDTSLNCVILIPSRLASTRLPNKPLADICGLPMIVQVWKRAREADIGRVVVAAGDQEIADAVLDHGGEAVMTDPDLPSGSDRITAALAQIDPDRRFQAVVNLQGDLPTIDPALIKTVLRPLNQLGADIGTLVVATSDPKERDDPSVVKAVVAFQTGRADSDPTLGKALYFTRATAPAGPGPIYHHIGIYAYRRAALERFAALPPSPLEQREKLEQLRALEHDMTIGVARVDTVPLGVDTPGQLDEARRLLG